MSAPGLRREVLPESLISHAESQYSQLWSRTAKIRSQYQIIRAIEEVLTLLFSSYPGGNGGDTYLLEESRFSVEKGKRHEGDRYVREIRS